MIELLSIPAIIALVEALKSLGVPKPYAPLASILTGIAFGLLVGDTVTGLLVGLSASGLYSGARAMLKP